MAWRFNRHVIGHLPTEFCMDLLAWAVLTRPILDVPLLPSFALLHVRGYLDIPGFRALAYERSK